MNCRSTQLWEEMVDTENDRERGHFGEGYGV